MLNRGFAFASSRPSSGLLKRRKQPISRGPFTVSWLTLQKARVAFWRLRIRFAGVSFLDDYLREYLTYGLRETEPGKLFLKQLTYREFEAGSDTVKFGATFVFQEDGAVQISKESFNPHVAEVANARVDVRRHYLPWPEFGEYDRLMEIQKLKLFPSLD